MYTCTDVKITVNELYSCSFLKHKNERTKNYTCVPKPSIQINFSPACYRCADQKIRLPLNTCKRHNLIAASRAVRVHIMLRSAAVRATRVRSLSTSTAPPSSAPKPTPDPVAAPPPRGGGVPVGRFLLLGVTAAGVGAAYRTHTNDGK